MFFIKISAFTILMFIALWLSFIFFFAGAFFYDDVIVSTAFLMTFLGIPVLLISFFSDKIILTKKIQFWIMALILIALPSVIKQTYFYYDRSYLRLPDTELKILEYHPHKLLAEKIYLGKPAMVKLTDDNEKQNVSRAILPFYSAVSKIVYPERQNKYDNVVSRNSTNRTYEHLIRRNIKIVSNARLSKEKFTHAKNLYIRAKFMSGIQSTIDGQPTPLSKPDWRQVSISKFMNDIKPKANTSSLKINIMEVDFPFRHFTQLIMKDTLFDSGTSHQDSDSVSTSLNTGVYQLLPIQSDSVATQASLFK